MEDEWVFVGVKKNGRKSESGSGSHTHNAHRSEKSKRDEARVRELMRSLAEDDALPESKSKPMVLKRLEDACEALVVTKFYRDSVHHLSTVLNLNDQNEDENENENDVRQIVCLGVGNFATQPASFLQMALLLCLQKYLFSNTSLSGKVPSHSGKVPSQTVDEKESKEDGEREKEGTDGITTISGIAVVPTTRIYTYEPLLSSLEYECCQALDIQLLDNKRGKYNVLKLDECVQKCCDGKCDSDSNFKENQQDDVPLFSGNSFKTLFYMPHCPYSLYANVLWSNWTHLNRILILGNSFESYACRRFNNSHSINTNSTKKKLSGKKEEVVLEVDCVQLLTNVVLENMIYQDYHENIFIDKSYKKISETSKELNASNMEKAFIDTALMYFSDDVVDKMNDTGLQQQPLEDQVDLFCVNADPEMMN